MKIIIACEESQAVCKAFREKGHEAYSADILPCSGGHPEWHIQGNVLEILNDGWGMMIAFPPCTHLAVSGAAHFEKKRADGRQQQGIDFFMKMVNAPIEKIVVENPISIMSKVYRKPDQIIQPFFFGDGYQKSTCLWLKNVQPLFHNSKPDLFNKTTTHVEFEERHYLTDRKTGKLKSQPMWYYKALTDSKTAHERSVLRSKTFPGIAKAMSQQWG